MRTPCSTLLAVLFVAALLADCRGKEPGKDDGSLTGIVLIGVQTDDAPKDCSIQLMSREGKITRELVRHKSRSIYPGGRVSRQGDRVAYCLVPEEGEAEIRTVDSSGRSVKVADGKGMLTAWSPDGGQIALYRNAAGGRTFESVVLDLSSGMETVLKLPADYVAEAWHPRSATRTAIYMNPRNRMYRPKKGDHYPARQLDLLIEDGKRQPLTRNPSTDNIWSRFSPDGKLIAHYGRRLSGETALEYVVVCQADGTEPREVFGFTEFGKANGLPWFRPNGFPAWSPDGKTLAWIVSANKEATSQGEQMEVVHCSTTEGKPRRISLAEKGIRRVAGIDWQ